MMVISSGGVQHLIELVADQHDGSAFSRHHLSQGAEQLLRLLGSEH